MMRIGIIGIGDICKKAYLPILTSNPNLELVLCTRNEKTLQEIKQQYRIQEGYQTVDELIASNIDAAIVNAATSAHYELCKTLIENHIPVLVDKPISDDLEKTQNLYQLATLHQTKLMVGFNRRFAPAVSALPQLGKADIIMMEKNRVNLPGDLRTFIYDDFIHVVDTLRFLMGEEPTDISVRFKGDERQLIHVILTLANDTTTAIGIMNRDNGSNEETIEYMASGKKAVVTSLVKTEQLINNQTTLHEFGDWVPTLTKRGFEAMLKNYLDFVNKEQSASITLEDAMKTHELCELIIEKIKDKLS